MARRLAVALAKADRSIRQSLMHYVYILKSTSHEGRFYVGCTSDLKMRVAQHNEGATTSTAPFRPWRLHWYCAFETRTKAEAFESYLKSACGRAFQVRHL